MIYFPLKPYRNMTPGWNTAVARLLPAELTTAFAALAYGMMYVFDLPNRKATPMFPLKAGVTLLVAWEVENPVSTISTSETDPVPDCAAT
jgi:hypothetical protein